VSADGSTSALADVYTEWWPLSVLEAACRMVLPELAASAAAMLVLDWCTNGEYVPIGVEEATLEALVMAEPSSPLDAGWQTLDLEEVSQLVRARRIMALAVPRSRLDSSNRWFAQVGDLYAAGGCSLDRLMSCWVVVDRSDPRRRRSGSSGVPLENVPDWAPIVGASLGLPPEPERGLDDEELGDLLVARRDPARLPGWDALTARQQEVVPLMMRYRRPDRSEHACAQRVAKRLGISWRTVLDHWHDALERVHAAKEAERKARAALNLQQEGDEPLGDGRKSDWVAMSQVFGETLDDRGSDVDNRRAVIGKESQGSGARYPRRTPRRIRDLCEEFGPIARGDLLDRLEGEGIRRGDAAVVISELLVRLDPKYSIAQFVQGGITYYVRRPATTTSRVDRLPDIDDDRQPIGPLGIHTERRVRAGVPDKDVSKKSDLSHREAFDPAGKMPAQRVTMPGDVMGNEDTETADPDDADLWAIVVGDAPEAYDTLSRRRKPTESAVINLLGQLAEISEDRVRRLIREHEVEWGQTTASWDLAATTERETPVD
jgi:hypothetical protein